MTARPEAGAKHIIITIDGAAGTGKSTAAHRLARRLGLEFLDTGAMYRAVAMLALDQNLDLTDGPAIAAALRAVDLHFDWDHDPPRLLIDDADVSDRIRDLEVSRHVSIVAAHPEVREVLVEQQRSISRQHPRLVSEGRDQGSVVFPDAPLRFFLKADAKVRAERRLDQLRAAGQNVQLDDVIADIERRDEIDASRATNPLIVPDGAIIVETDDQSLDEVVDTLEAHVRSALADPERRP